MKLSVRSTAAGVFVLAALIGGIAPIIVGPLKLQEFNFLSSGYILFIYGVYVIAAWLIKVDIYWGPVVSKAGNQDRVVDLALGVIVGSVGVYMVVSYWAGVWKI
nr:putative integron gene cassette protein [uncultured bacterium]CAP47854.1 putative integron gene cassette protein [uncultured bacterium]